MITSRVQAIPRFGELEELIQARTQAALNAAAAAGVEVANARAQGITEFHVLPAGRAPEGYRSGIKAANPIWHVFDKGSLGKRVAKLKRDRRKDSWPVTRKRTTYTAHRRSTDTGGVDARNIANPARTAGRHALLAALQGR